MSARVVPFACATRRPQPSFSGSLERKARKLARLDADAARVIEGMIDVAINDATAGGRRQPGDPSMRPHLGRLDPGFLNRLGDLQARRPAAIHVLNDMVSDMLQEEQPAPRRDSPIHAKLRRLERCRPSASQIVEAVVDRFLRDHEPLTGA